MLTLIVKFLLRKFTKKKMKINLKTLKNFLRSGNFQISDTDFIDF